MKAQGANVDDTVTFTDDSFASDDKTSTTSVAGKSVSSAKSSATSAMRNTIKNAAKSANVVKKASGTVRDRVKDAVSGRELSWEELCAIEKRRRAVLKRTELPFFRILLFWDGTVLKLLSTDPLLWITLLIYLLMRIGARVGMPDFVSDLGGADIGVIGGFLSFFLVFFVVTSGKRFDALYNTSMSCEGRIFDAAALARTTLPRERAVRLVRYMNAVHVAGYVGLSDTYNFDNFFAEINVTNRILTEKEVARILHIDMNKGGSAYRELVVWCCAEVSDAQKAGLIDGRLASQYRDLILRLRGALGGLYDFDDQPVSFFYVHFVCLLSAMYLPLFAVSAGLAAGTGDDAYWLNDIIQGLIVLVQVVFVIGLRLLAIKQANPYGDDVEDLSVMHYVNFTWLMSNRMLNPELPSQPANSLEEETNLSYTQHIGDAWENSEVVTEMLPEDSSDNFELMAAMSPKFT